MNIQSSHANSERLSIIRIFYYFLCLAAVLVPLSCAAQNSALSQISSAERSDGQGHVIRFHLNQPNATFDFSQPQAHLLQLELSGQQIDTTNINIVDESAIIESIEYYQLNGGIGVDIFLNQDTYYQANAYPDGASSDILLGLTSSTPQALAQHIESMQIFSWSDAPQNTAPVVVENQDEPEPSGTDTTYQKVKNKVKFDVVVLDAGHGGGDVGTHHNGVYEKNIVLDITKKVGNYIKENMPDVKVVYTRNDDRFIELEERGPIANRAEGDLFVSIHANAVPSAPHVHGTETYFLGLERSESALRVMERENQVINPDGEESRELTQEDLIIYELANSGYLASSEKLAGMVEDQFKNRAQRHSRGVKQARFVVLYQASMPAILIETGFISNRSEANYLTSDYGQSIIASAIFRAIRNYKQDLEKSQHLSTN